MRKISMLFFVAVLSSAMAVAQATSPSSQPASGTQAQTQPAPQNNQAPSAKPPADQNASPADQGTANPNAQNGSANAAGTNPNGTAANPQQNQGATQRTAGNSSGVPWGWIIVGIIVIAIILALIGRGSSDRVERRETIERDRTLGPREVTTERRDDDIRRVG